MNHVLSAGLLWAAAASAASAATPVPTSAVVSVAEGPPFVLIRGAVVYMASRGAELRPGDLIESKPGGLLILEFGSGAAASAIVAIGPSTRAYWMDHRKIATLAVLGGWIKVDTLSSVQGGEFRIDGPRLGATSSAGIYVVHVGEEADEVFHERGTMTRWAQQPGGGAANAANAASTSSKPSEFASRTDTGAIQTRLGPGAAFGSAMPSAFRDPLPAGMSAKLHGKTEPQILRDAAYEDVADWLAAPREWRRGFIERFRPRLKDPAFFQALDAHMSAHPEWNRILHPPPVPIAMISDNLWWGFGGGCR
jgi:hypothetical protein